MAFAGEQLHEGSLDLHSGEERNNSNNSNNGNGIIAENGNA